MWRVKALINIADAVNLRPNLRDKINHLNQRLLMTVRNLIDKRALLFLIVGIIGVLLNFIIYTGLILLHLNYVIASSVGWTIAFLVGGFLNQKFTFGLKNLSGSVIAATLPVYLLTQIFVLYSLPVIGAAFNLGQIASYAILLPFAVGLNYIAVRYFVERVRG